MMVFCMMYDPRKFGVANEELQEKIVLFWGGRQTRTSTSLLYVFVFVVVCLTVCFCHNGNPRDTL